MYLPTKYMIEEGIYELEDKSIEIIHCKEHRGK
jgi:hypothetical protein